MILLLDLGNSRIKWALAESGAFLRQGVAENVAELAWDDLPTPRRVLGCCVASDAMREAIALAVLARFGLAVEWLHPQAEQGGVNNHYDVARLGADRWAAVLGARARFPGQALVVVSAGTALVVDALTAHGDFLGGMILPGYRLMKSSLAQGTARLPLASGEFRPFPRTTDDAIETGCLSAQAGAIEAMAARLAAAGQRDVRVLLSGGDAARLAPCLSQPCAIVDNLALYGLAALAAPDQETPR